jgi:hypothetical protein
MIHWKHFILALTLSLGYQGISQNVVINELDSATPSTDTQEFVELKTTNPFESLDGYVLVLFNGSTSASSGQGRSYRAIDLDGLVTDVNGLIVLGGNLVSPVPDFVLSENTFQNGSDAVAIYQGDASDFPDQSTFATTTNLVDVIVYDTGQSDNQNLLNLLGQTVQYNENENGNRDTESLQRKADGTFEAKLPTPHSLNDASSLTYVGVDFMISATELNEGDAFSITFSLTESQTTDTDLGFTLSNGGFDNADFTGTTQVTIPANTTSATLNFTIIDDLLDEGDEFLRINLNNADIPAGFKRIKDNLIVIVIDNDFQVAGYGTPLAPTYGTVMSNAPTDYYASIDGQSGVGLEQSIVALIANADMVRIHTYNDVTEILKDADKSPLNSNRVWLMYTEQERAISDFQTGSNSTGKWNREHIYSRSRGGFFGIEYDDEVDGMSIWTETNADSLRHGMSDAHHLRAVDGPENSSRGNSDYPDYNGPSGSQGSWHGDVARALFYMDLRYNNLALVDGNPPDATVGALGDLATLIQWHRNDPPDDFEMNRNNVIYSWQFNRNPFIDNPELVEFLYGNQVGQTFTLSTESIDLETLRLSPNPSARQFSITGLDREATLVIYDQLGRKINQRPIENNEVVNHQLPSGIYILQILSGEKSTTRKLIVK